MFLYIAPGLEAPEWEPDLDWDWEPDLHGEPGEPPCDGPPCGEDVWELIRKRGMALDFLLPGRAMRAVPGEPGRFTYRSPAAEALAEFINGLDPDGFGTWSVMVMAGLMFLREWAADHQAPPPPLLRRAFLVLLALLVISRRPGHLGRPGRPDDVLVRGPSAPLVRAHAILTAAPPCSPAPVPRGSPSLT